ncbi:cupin domain-containing protein [Patescibacteria group bacterium]|nr:cupin domain-containing protein [Patescibacteria group bacterium]
MKTYNFGGDPGVITGQENNPDLFIRKTNFPAGYTETDYHNHPNSYEFYVVLQGQIKFESSNKEICDASSGSLVYFNEAESHRIVMVGEDVEMLLIKRLGATKS